MPHSCTSERCRLSNSQQSHHHFFGSSHLDFETLHFFCITPHSSGLTKAISLFTSKRSRQCANAGFIFLFVCGWCDGDASKFSGKNTKLGVRSSGVAKRQGEDQGSTQHDEGSILQLALLEMAAHGVNCPGFQDYVCFLNVGLGEALHRSQLWVLHLQNQES